MTANLMSSDTALAAQPDSADAVPPRPSAPAARGWWMSVALLTGVQLAMRWWAVLGVGNYHDDVAVTYRALDNSLSADYLFLTYAGQWSPIGRLIEWLTVRAAPFDAPTAHLVTLTILAVGDVGMALGLSTAFGRRIGTVVLYACWLFTPLLSVAIGWWSLGLNISVLIAAMAWAFFLHLRAVQSGEWPRLAMACAALLMVLLTGPPGLVFVPFLIGYTWAIQMRSGRSERRIIGLFRPFRLWLGYAGMVVIFLGAYLLSRPERVTNPLSVSAVGKVAWQMVLGVGVPGLFGGTWASDPGPAPSAAALSVLPLSFVLQLFVLVVMVSLLMRTNAWRAWLVLLTLAIGYSVLIAVAVRFDIIAELLRQTRYLVPLLVPAYVLLGVALLTGDLRPWAKRLLQHRAARPTALGALILAGVVVVESSWFSSYQTARAMKEASTDAFWSNVTSGLVAHPDVVLIDREMPPGVLFAGYLPEFGYASSALRHFVVDQTWNQPTDEPYIITDDGQVVPAKVEPFAVSAPGPRESCGYLVDGTAWVVIPMSAATFNWRWGIQMNYLAAAGSTLEVSTAGGIQELPVSRGLGSVIWTSPGAIDEVKVRSKSRYSAPVCVDSITVGGLVPAQ